MLFIDASFAVGLAVFAAASAMLAGHTLATLLGISTIALHLGAAIVLLTILGLIAVIIRAGRPLMLGGFALAMPRPRIALAQLTIAGLDLLAASMVLRVLMPAANVDFFSFAAIFAAAVAIGVISRVPGGLGVFEIVVFVSLAQPRPAQ